MQFASIKFDCARCFHHSRVVQEGDAFQMHDKSVFQQTAAIFGFV